MNIKWPTLLNDYFGNVITRCQVDTWWRELTESDISIRGLTDDEICTTIRWAVSNVDIKMRGKPTLRDLRIWIFSRRKEDRGKQVANTAPDDQFMNRMAYEMRQHRDDPEAVWNIMVDPQNYMGAERDSTVPECDALKAWAEHELKIDFGSFHVDLEPFDKIAETLTDVEQVTEEYPI